VNDRCPRVTNLGVRRIFLATVCVVTVGCGGDFAPPIDAASEDDAALDAASEDDAALDATMPDAAAPDAPPTDAAAGDASAVDAPAVDAPGPIVPIIPVPDGWRAISNSAGNFEPFVASASEDVVLCTTDNHPPSPHYFVDRISPTAYTPSSFFGSATCRNLAVIDETHVMAAIGDYAGAPALLARLDLATRTQDVILLPTPSGSTVARANLVRRVPGGFVAVGLYDIPGGYQTRVWRVDDAGAVTWSVPVVGSQTAPDAMLFPATAPTEVVVIGEAGVATRLDLATGAVLGTIAIPVGNVSLLATPSGIVAVGDVGGQQIVMPLDSSIATVLPGGSFVVTLDPQRRLVVLARTDDLRQVDLYRLDFAHFDGVDGDSRFDPSFGAGGHARLLAPAECAAVTPQCYGEGFGITFAAGGRAVVTLGIRANVPWSTTYIAWMTL